MIMIWILHKFHKFIVALKFQIIAEFSPVAATVTELSDLVETVK